MKSPLIIPSVLTLALHLSLSLSAQEMEIFNGKDLTGWRGLPAVWAVQDGAITGRAAENRENTFLIWEGGTVKDFEFSCEYKLIANNPEKIANSGIQFRAHIVDNAGLKLTGYQAEMDNGAQRPKRWPVMKNTNGSVIEDAPGKLLAPAGQRTVAQNGNVPDNPMMGIYTTTGTTTSQEVLDRVYLKGGWNSLRIIAHGNRIQTYINGLPAAECVDSAYRYQSGHLGLQYHGRGAKTVQFKNLKLTHLRDAPLVAQTPDVSPAPSSSPAPTASPSPSRATDTLPPLKACLLDYMWEWNSPLGKTLAAFQPDGALILKDKRALKWSMTGSQTIQVTGDSGKAVELVFDTTFSTFKMSSAAGSNESSQIWGTRSTTLPPRLESVITTRAWAWRQVWAPPSKRWSEVRFDRDGTFRAFHGTSLAYTGKWELAGPGRIKIPNNKIPFISTFGYFLQFDNELTRFEATDLGKRKVPGENIGPASQAPLPLPPPKPEDEFRTAFAMVGGGSNGGTNFGFGDTKRTLDVSINTASDDHIHVTVKASWVVLTPGRQLVPSRTETRKFTIGGDHPYYEKFSITSVWQRTNGMTDGITNEDGVLRGWVVRAYDVHGKEISAAASQPAYLGIGK